jgi:hypothetical protein
MCTDMARLYLAYVRLQDRRLGPVHPHTVAATANWRHGKGFTLSVRRLEAESRTGRDRII